MSEPGPRALIVDDERAVRNLTERSLKRVGFHCATAGDGKQAKCILETATFDVVVTDLRMPVEHGYSLAAMLLALEKRPLVIVLTGVYEPRLAKEMQRLGVDEIVFKPVDYGEFARKVRRLVDQRQRESSGETKPQPHEKSPAESTSEEPCRKPSAKRQSATDGSARTIQRRVERKRRRSRRNPATEVRSAARSSTTAESPPTATRSSSSAVATLEAPPAAPQVQFQPAIPTTPLQRPSPPQLPIGLDPSYPELLAPIVVTSRGAQWALLVVPFGLLTILSFWLGVQATLFFQQRQTIKQVEALGAKVARTKEGKLHVHFTSDANSAALLHLHRLNYLEAFDASRSHVRDHDLSHLTRLPDLRHLDIAHTAISDEGLGNLRDLKLKSLNLRGTEVSHAGIADLLHSNELEEVDLHDTAVTAQGLTYLRSAFPDTQFHHEPQEATEHSPHDFFEP